MEPKELLTKRRIEKLASGYDFGRIKSHTPNPEGKYDVFISHSNRDIEFIRKVLLFLKNSKSVGTPFVDWQDPELSHMASAHTAQVLKLRIENAKKVIYVVTSESLKSTWCSWKSVLQIVPRELKISLFLLFGRITVAGRTMSIFNNIPGYYMINLNIFLWLQCPTEKGYQCMNG